MEERKRYQLTPKGEEMADKLSAKPNSVLPKLNNKQTVAESENKGSAKILSNQIYELMVKAREEEIAHREKMNNLKEQEHLEEDKKNQELIDAIRGRDKPKAAKKTKKLKLSLHLDALISLKEHRKSSTKWLLKSKKCLHQISSKSCWRLY